METDLESEKSGAPETTVLPERTQPGLAWLYDERLADLLCERIAAGGHLAAICRTPGMPARRTVYYWLQRYPDFARRYAAAVAERTDGWAEEIIAIADSAAAGGYEALAAARLKIAARQWLAGKLLPRKYGAQLLMSDMPGEDEAGRRLALAQTRETARALLDGIAAMRGGGSQGGGRQGDEPE